MLAPDTVVVGSHFFGGNGYGIQIGANGYWVGHCTIDAKVSNCPGTAVIFTQGWEEQNTVRLNVVRASTATLIGGYPHYYDQLEIIDSQGGSTSRYQIPGQIVLGTGSSGDALGFYGGTPGTGVGVTQQTVTGSRSGNAALASLLTALAKLNLIVDNSTS